MLEVLFSFLTEPQHFLKELNNIGKFKEGVSFVAGLEETLRIIVAKSVKLSEFSIENIQRLGGVDNFLTFNKQ